jgi:hypothetical protein
LAEKKKPSGKKAAEEQASKDYEVKDKRRVNADGSLKEEPEAEEPKPAETPQAQPAEAPSVEQQAEAPAADPAEAPSAEQAEPADHEPQAEQQIPGADMPPPSIFDTLQFVTGLLAEQAWQFMGLHLPPGHKEPVTDMVQAKLAIDTIIFVADKLHPHLDDESRRAIRGIISDLQINFVQRNR